MPELPEVEFAARCLRKWIVGRKLLAVEARPSRVLRPCTPRDFAPLAGRRVREVRRHGKVLLVALDGGWGLFAHLGMTGKFVLEEGGPPPHSRARLRVSGAGAVHFNDPRMFGRLVPGRLADLQALEHIRKLGPDALAGGAEPEVLGPRLAATARPVKVALMDQRLVAGLGNIHVTETLWRARIHPLRPSRSLSRGEVRRLSRAIRDSLEHALAEEEGEEITYVEEGGDNPFLVYARAGEPCPRCRTKLVKLDIGGRTTAFCPRCQRL